MKRFQLLAINLFLLFLQRFSVMHAFEHDDVEHQELPCCVASSFLEQQNIIANEANIFNFESLEFDFHRFDFVEFQQKYKFSFYLLRAPPLLKV